MIGHGGPVRQATELAIGVAFRTLQNLLGSDWRPRRVCFAHDAPADRTIHDRIFGRSVEFGHDFNGIVCALADLARPNAQADPELARLAQRMLDGQRAARAHGGHRARRCASLVVTLLGTGACTIDRAAQHLGVDRRTIHRRLAKEGETFSSIVDAVRRELAQRYLADKRSLAEIAMLLGFSASSGFSHWYRRQYDATPSSRRNAVKAKAGVAITAVRSCSSAAVTVTSANAPGLSLPPPVTRTMPSISGASAAERATASRPCDLVHEHAHRRADLARELARR